MQDRRKKKRNDGWKEGEYKGVKRFMEVMNRRRNSK